MSDFCKACTEQKLKDSYKNVDENPGSKKEFEESLQAMLDSVFADRCVTSSTVVTGQQKQGQKKRNIWGANSQEYINEIPMGNDTTSFACEDLVLMASNHAVAKRSIVNILSCSCASTEVNIGLRNKMRIRLRRVTCKGALRLAQDIVADVNMITGVTSEQQNEITQVTENFLTETMDTIRQNIERNAPSGDKTISNAFTNIKEDNVRNAAANAVSSLRLDAFGDNVMDIVIEDSDIGGNCEFSQNIVLEVVAKQILKNAMGNIMEDTSVSDVVKDFKATKTVIQDEDPYVNQEWKLPEMKEMSDPGPGKGMYIASIVCFVVILLGVGIVFYVKFRKAKFATNLQSQQSYQQYDQAMVQSLSNNPGLVTQYLHNHPYPYGPQSQPRMY